MVDFTTLGLTVVGGFSFGYVVGWAIKKMVGVIEAFAAFEVLIFGFLATTGVITFNPQAALSLIGWFSQKIFGAISLDTLVTTFGTVTIPTVAGTLFGLVHSSHSLTRYDFENLEWLETIEEKEKE
ncbi:MAG: hypothetical protein JHC26_07430 [Thermofilum sp.]|jgi:uncharacterized membrane protein (Fun14 family)|uniref:hypothetical protein n=1 Tax=Thermofilum sp. TaxID=1961369 RepID=UPI00259057B2|nr:hypothetical protein [Thermofilum sp.]MCI4408908.1 hypothetical protein [Thermofilum sp.]